MSASVYSVRASVVSGVSSSSSKSSKSKITRSTGRGGAGNIKHAFSSPVLGALSIYTLPAAELKSVAGREAPTSPTSAKATRSTGRGGSGNISRTRAKSGAAPAPLPAHTASIVAEYERAKERREKEVIGRSMEARKRNVGASGRGGAGNNYLTVSPKRTARASSFSTFSNIPESDQASTFDLPGPANPRYKPRASLWSKLKAPKSKKSKKEKRDPPVLDARSVLDIVVEDAPAHAARHRTSSPVPSAHRRAVLFPSSSSLASVSVYSEPDPDHVSAHTFGPAAAAHRRRSSSSSSSSDSDTTSLIASASSCSPTWWHRGVQTDPVPGSRPASEGASVSRSRASWLGGRAGSDGSSAYSRWSAQTRETGGTFGAPSSVRWLAPTPAPSLEMEVDEDSEEENEVRSPRPGHSRTDTDASALSLAGAAAIAQVGRGLLEPLSVAPAMALAGSAVPSSLTLSLVPPSPGARRGMPPSPRAPTGPLPLPPAPSSPSSPEECSSDEDAVDPRRPAPRTQRSFSLLPASAPLLVVSASARHTLPPALPTPVGGPPRAQAFNLPRLVLPPRRAPGTWPDAPVTDTGASLAFGSTPGSIGVPRSVGASWTDGDVSSAGGWMMEEGGGEEVVLAYLDDQFEDERGAESETETEEFDERVWPRVPSAPLVSGREASFFNF